MFQEDLEAAGAGGTGTKFLVFLQVFLRCFLRKCFFRFLRSQNFRCFTCFEDQLKLFSGGCWTSWRRTFGAEMTGRLPTAEGWAGFGIDRKNMGVVSSLFLLRDSEPDCVFFCCLTWVFAFRHEGKEVKNIQTDGKWYQRLLLTSLMTVSHIVGLEGWNSEESQRSINI